MRVSIKIFVKWTKAATVGDSVENCFVECLQGLCTMNPMEEAYVFTYVHAGEDDSSWHATRSHPKYLIVNSILVREWYSWNCPLRDSLFRFFHNENTMKLIALL